MSMANRILLWVLAALLIAGVSWYTVWFFNNYERQVREQRVEVSPEALRNRFLAAEHYLKALDYQAESFQARDLISDLPPPGDALLLRRMQPNLTDDQLYTLNDWIEAGGVLIVSPQHYSYADGRDEADMNLESQDRFLADLGIRMYALDVDETELDESALEESVVEGQASGGLSENAAADDSEESGYLQISLSVVGETDALKASVRRDRYLVDTDNWATERISSEFGDHYLKFNSGLGSVVVLSDLELFTNDRIGKLDHAYLLSRIVGNSRKVWLQYSIDMLPLPLLLWQRMPFLVTALALLLILMGWRLFLYTGPRLFLQNQQRRNLMEHIDASAHYAWRIDKGYSLFESNRQALEQAWRKRHPGLNSMNNSQRAEWIGEKTGMAGQAVERSLYHSIDKDQDFIKASLVLQQLASGLKQRGLR
ncbi:DUF4350 domain-containing protein [Amphritea sp.]|uniref:DUF4350 domain-containing protein n=1 Tax=Amphritea sp. TaxID=1872502 RepID=UPI0025C180C9|nr:DUF4350 domain-containing protein [Amphritea sp.]